MATLIVPELDDTPWPTLGAQIVHFIESFMVYGPGDLRGQPYKVSPEFRAQLYRSYEVFPPDHRREGKRRFKRVTWSERKGTAKTERAAIVAACEAHPRGPVRFDRWAVEGEESWWGYKYRPGEPVGRSVLDPYIPMVAYTQDQTEELAYGALVAILEESELGVDFDIGLERIVPLRNGKASGKVLPLAGSPNARDGARTTFQHFDETHRFTLDSLRRAHRTMLANIPKRPMADPWSLETTTSFTPGEQSVAESTMRYARAIDEGKVKDPQMFFFHRQAGDGHDLKTAEGRRAAVIEASGPAADWSDIDGIVAQWDEPDTDPAYLERVWLNRPTQAGRQAFDAARWDELADSSIVVPDGEQITLGFDGARYRDATALVATHIGWGFQWPLGIWERPLNAGPDWEVPEDEVDLAVEGAFERFDVWRLYADPPYWETAVERWRGRWGDKRVVQWWTRDTKKMVYAISAYRTAQKAGELSHNGDKAFARHIGNARRLDTHFVDEQGQPLFIIRKEQPDSADKIDAAMAGCLSWEARGDAVAAGMLVEEAEPAEFVTFG